MSCGATFCAFSPRPQWKPASARSTRRSNPPAHPTLYLPSEPTITSQLTLPSHRYDREVHKGDRPLLRAVAQQDRAPRAPMVLMVSSLPPGATFHPAASGQGPPMVIEVTDGWYALGAVLDKPLAEAVAQSRIQVGAGPLPFGGAAMGSLGFNRQP